MAHFPFELTGSIGARTLGLIVLQQDETLEQDFRRLFGAQDVAVYVSRVPSGEDVTPDTLAAMEATLPAAAQLLPPAAPFDVVGYGCTSGTTMIGAEKVAELVCRGVGEVAVSDPLTAALAACSTLGLRSIGMVTPYIDSVSVPVRRAFEAAGIAVPRTVSFGEAGEARVARIDPASIRAAALEVGTSDDVDGVFLSCTNLRTLDVIAEVEEALGKPVLSSNQALAWHMARLSGAPVADDAPGKIFAI
ncbi:maleate cis-trans isomerase family protein [Shimia aestuarii]|uniref:Maleate isomerase n=1 Tax=Shimia aestuarii TaxID=254406 RepID=A0A1I4HIW6_9RHOB|nr:aspartate/glutamate racemase family protein [Shimia aestuarii]SFL42064.1 maleate isomerase [Shimia aestuarii]